ncbi:diaminopropionate ammonia-lyase [Pseudemcibacter aquimaris]|uniref:diaminopropionate ammonia-lyase n=1 Tax=Pseudemcibacter aquimaris TaxID=2857064 RepID=UPI002011F0ED|nr:diaminopropionate ammonia-lyase [Pseudemcibacter aquimaris]MCC3859641.1 diaminopropionate ammonia-lyase [Pseudemcibacter aquimaris]WDU60036.1 diaminopropionate ammonia-lyase [Pseudemcibacter aquimaris]
MQHFKNNPEYSNTDHVLNPKLFEEAYESIKNWSGYQPSPLQDLNGMANELGVNKIYFKDESERFGLKSFKSLGGAYAVVRVLKEHLQTKHQGQEITDEDLKSGKYAEELKNFTVVTATDGNHGRSVAWGAHECGINCKIYMHKGVSKSRGIAVELLGAEVVWVDGNYDDSLVRVKHDAIENEWYIISDTSYDGYTYVPKFVMAGYTVMTYEIAKQMEEEQIPTHIIVQGGVGGLAGAVCAHMAAIWKEHRPRFVIVEPETADCLYQSAKAGKPTMVDIKVETLMGGLSCGEPSTIGWNILKDNTDDFITISDDNIKSAMRLIAMGVGGDHGVEAGESGVAGIAALMEIKDNDEMRAALGINTDSRILLFGTEGATDPELYKDIVGS